MNIPKLRFPEFSGEWEVKKIRDYAECRAGATPDTKNNAYWDNGTISWMSSGEVNNKFIYFTEKKITRLGYEKTSTQLLPINTVVIALAGQGKTRGTVAITRTELCTNQSLCGILNSTELNSEYLFQFLSSQYKQLRASSTGGDESRGGLNLQIIGNFRLSYTSLPEQQKIADFLSTVDSIISSETKILNALQKKKKALMQKLFSQQLRFKADDGSDFPEWEEKKLEECVEILDKQRKPIESKERADRKGNYPYYGASGIIDYIDDYLFEGESILLGEDGANIINRNSRLAFIATGKYWVNNHAHIMKAINENSNYFICEYLESLDYSKKCAGSAQPKLTQEIIRNLEIYLPCKEEQQKIADCLSSLDNLIQNQQKIVSNWQQRKKGLLQQMFV